MRKHMYDREWLRQLLNTSYPPSTAGIPIVATRLSSSRVHGSGSALAASSCDSPFPTLGARRVDALPSWLTNHSRVPVPVTIHFSGLQPEHGSEFLTVTMRHQTV